jgi:hypothetical protein
VEGPLSGSGVRFTDRAPSPVKRIFAAMQLVRADER